MAQLLMGKLAQAAMHALNPNAGAAEQGEEEEYQTPQHGAPGAPPPGYGAPPPGYGAPPPGYGAPPPGYGAPPPGYGAPPPGYGAPPGGYGAPPPGYGAPPPGYGAPPGGYGAPPGGYGAPPPGYGAPPGGYGAPPPGFGGGDQYGAPPVGAPLPGYSSYGGGSPSGYPGYGPPPPGYGGGSDAPRDTSPGGVPPDGNFLPQGMSGFATPPGREIETMLLLDVTGSMTYPVSDTDSTPRKEIVHEAIGTIVSRLAKLDSQAGHESESGGLRTITFAGGRATDLDDLSPGNLGKKWASIKWAGGTKIMPGWKMLMQVYNDEFGSRPPAAQPVLMALVITDGEAEDSDQFLAALSHLSPNTFVVFAIVGYGDEAAVVYRAYADLSARNPQVRTLSFSAETDPVKIANALTQLSGI